MTRRNDIEFNVDTVGIQRQVTMTISISNRSPNDYYIVRDALLLDGFKVQFFSITGPSRIQCFFHANNNHKSELVSLQKDTTLTNSVQLSTVCNFLCAAPGTYTINFNTYLDLYDCLNRESKSTTEFTYLIGQSNFTLEDSCRREILLGISSDEGERQPN